MPELVVVDELAAYLIAASVGQSNDAAPSLDVPSVWVAPSEGIPEPRDGENVTITLTDTLLGPPSSLEAWMEEAFIDVTVRARVAASPIETLVQRSIRSLLAPPNDAGGKKQWMMGALLVEYSTVWRGDQPLPPADPQNVTTYDRRQSFRIAARRKALSGLPYVP